MPSMKKTEKPVNFILQNRIRRLGAKI